MLKSLAFAAVVSAFALNAGPSQSMPLQVPEADSADVIQIADGCGRGKYRGPWGSCHRFGTGPYPGGYNGPRGRNCPPGFWHGPWGHCRDTPYHGRLPGGGWK